MRVLEIGVWSSWRKKCEACGVRGVKPKYIGFFFSNPNSSFLKTLVFPFSLNWRWLRFCTTSVLGYTLACCIWWLINSQNWHYDCFPFLEIFGWSLGLPPLSQKYSERLEEIYISIPMSPVSRDKIGKLLMDLYYNFWSHNDIHYGYSIFLPKLSIITNRTVYLSLTSIY